MLKKRKTRKKSKRKKEKTKKKMKKTKKKKKTENLKKSTITSVGVGEKRISRRVIAIIIASVLVILSFLIIKPYLGALLFGLILAFIFSKPYKKLNKLIKKPTISSAIVCLVVILIIVVGLFLIAQIAIKEAFNLFVSIQKLDIFNLINTILVRVFPDSPELTRQITTSLQQALISLTNSFMNQLGKILTNVPQLFIQFFITFFVMFYFLKEGDNVTKFIYEMLPFSREVNEKFIKRSREVAHATIYGQIIIGILQGIVAGIGFYIFKAPSPLFFTILAILLSILPFVGSWLVWFPVALAMIAAGDVLNGVLLMIFGLIVVGIIDDIIRPFVVGKKAKINALIVLIGMLGGLILLGPVGLIIGPIILEYLLIFVELYRIGKIKFAF